MQRNAQPPRHFADEPIVQVEGARRVPLGREQVSEPRFAFPRLSRPSQVSVVVRDIKGDPKVAVPLRCQPPTDRIQTP
ncbi:hypothetical protein HRbin17_02535 [bacterium HR17]|uniref:Uncharacterized protein n=1 Tax=Candidatus Fervidibacter japonicus TaxID=2035412 RepID=A0A2H5XFN7_9BACT|nr:hypothetical protein HRbin17_02535 [bacterium HR17]